jgi:hypothetical protein
MTPYTPKGCKFLSQTEDSQVRLIVQGAPFSGKTTSALTFPNPVILSFDRKVSAHLHRSDIPIAPFYDPKFVDTILPRPGLQAPCSKKEALTKWLSTEGLKLVHEQTLIIDGCSGIETAYHIWYKFNETELAHSTKGTFNKFIQWDLKKAYFEELWDCIKALQCDVIFICHEQKERDKEGEYNGKISPLLTGQAADKMGLNFTDYFRQLCIAKPKTDDETQRALSYFGINATTLKEWCASTPINYGSFHLWKIQGDDTFGGGSSSLRDAPKYILANYETFQKYRKQFVDTNKPQA